VVTHCWSVIWQTLRMKTIRSQRTGCKISTKQSFKWVILSNGTSTVCYKIHKRNLPSEWSWAMGHQHFVIKSTKEVFRVILSNGTWTFIKSWTFLSPLLSDWNWDSFWQVRNMWGEWVGASEIFIWWLICRNSLNQFAKTDRVLQTRLCTESLKEIHVQFDYICDNIYSDHID
jgi:hypothetical protein